MYRTLLLLPLLFLSFFGWAQSQIVKYDINKQNTSNNKSSNPDFFTVFNGKLFFTANDGVHGTQLWGIDHVSNTPTMITGLSTVNSMLPKSNLQILNNKLFFAAEDPANGFELFSYNGFGSVVLEKDIIPGNTGSSPSQFITFNNLLYFTIEPAASSPGVRELCSYDPATGTAVHYPSNISGFSIQHTSPLVPFQGKIYFAGSSNDHGFELYVFDPATSLYDTLINIQQGPDPTAQRPVSTIISGNKLYFTGFEDKIYGQELWMYDGVNLPTRITGTGVFGSLCEYSGKIYFDASDYALIPISYDPGTGNISGTTAQHPGYLGFHDPLVVGNKLYYRATDVSLGPELWVYDGVNLPELVADIWPLGPGSAPQSITYYDGAIYFSAQNDSETGRELFRLYHFPTTIQNVKFDGEVNVYPNPVKDNLTFSIKSQEQEILTIVLTDIIGKTVYTSGPLQYLKGSSHEHTVSMQALSPATYFYHVRNENGQLYLSGKVLKE